MVARYRLVFRTRLVARVELTGLLARLPLGMCSLAILLWLRARSASFAVPGIGVGAYAAALAVVSPLQGRLIDRRGRAVVLGLSTVGWALALVGLAVAGGAGAPAWSLVLISASVGAAMPPFGPAVRALVGELISDRAVRESAYSLDAVMQELVWITGPLLVGGVVALASPTVAVLLTAVIGAIGAAGLLAAAPPHAGTGSVGVHWAGPFSEQGLRTLLLPIAFVGVGLGAIEVGLPALAAHSGNRAASGVLVALWALGSLLGGLAFAVAGAGGPLVTRYRALLLSVALLAAPLILARSLPSAIALSILAGLSIAPFFTCLYALVGRLAPAGTETEAFAWTSTALTGGAALGLAGGGALSASVGIGGPFVLAVAVTLLAAALTWALLPVDVDRVSDLTPPRGPSTGPPQLRTPDAMHQCS